ncbi:MAG: maleylpyruvate isomerase N-terminal domain-containing protein [Anaerolineales bacterium]|nr:maleylpyruvate isomerase N-terminal domain-containing protein [Anaerolineales bacterium]
MNTLDILKFGHLTMVASLEKVDLSDWETPGVCGIWNVKDIVAHLASYELWHVEVLNDILGISAPTPIGGSRADNGDRFNDVEVEKRRESSAQEVFDEYRSGQSQLIALARKVPAGRYSENGTLPWYGKQYCLNDFLVYSSYGHKREHSAQVNAYRDRLGK